MEQVDHLASGSQRQPAQESKTQCYRQVVSIDFSAKKHVQTDTVKAWRNMDVAAVVQNFTKSRRSGTSSDSVDVYQEGDPEIVDLLRLGAWKVMFLEVTLWTGVAESSIPGCVRLSMPESGNKRVWSAIEIQSIRTCI